MQVHRSIESLPPFTNAAITIGTFDGVHLGHRKIIEALKEGARAASGESVLITFDPHPRQVIQPQKSIQLINTLEEKISLLAETGIDHLVVVPFTPDFADLSAESYIGDFLIGRFHPHTIIIGYDHHFGKGRTGNFHLLAREADRYQYQLLEIPKYLIDEIGVSSTEIRSAIRNSDIEAANRLLGYTYFFGGTVVKGDQLGRTLGYPTANLEYDYAEKIRLGHGVYAVDAFIGAEHRKGMLSIGDRPTLKVSGEKVEVHVFDWSGEIYGERMIVKVREFLRPQIRFDSLEELKVQMARDEERSR